MRQSRHRRGDPRSRGNFASLNIPRESACICGVIICVSLGVLSRRTRRVAKTSPCDPCDLRGLEVYPPGARRERIFLPHGSQRVQFHGRLIFAFHAFLAVKQVLVRNLDGLPGGERITFVPLSPFLAERHRLPLLHFLLMQQRLT